MRDGEQSGTSWILAKIPSEKEIMKNEYNKLTLNWNL